MENTVDKGRIYKQRAYLKRKNWYRAYKSTLVCSLCGENHPACLDFHHVDPTTKLFRVSAICRSVKQLKDEIAKCVVLCANCHRKEHYTL